MSTIVDTVVDLSESADGGPVTSQQANDFLEDLSGDPISIFTTPALSGLSLSDIVFDIFVSLPEVARSRFEWVAWRKRLNANNGKASTKVASSF